MSFSLKQSLQVLVVTVFVFFIFTPAANACGSIFYTENFGDGPEDYQDAIVDCDNPFNADVPAPLTVSLSIAAQEVTEGSVITVSATESIAGSFTVSPTNGFTINPFSLYFKEGGDYRRMLQSDSNNFELPTLPEGEYVAVFIYEDAPFLVEAEKGVRQWFKDLFLPQIALAFYPNETRVVTMSFSVAHTPVAPAGVSNILFLPGIMGSHLYEESNECFGFGEQKRWFSHTDCEQLRLLTNNDGSSQNSIYTKAGAVIDETLGLNLYKSFLGDLADWKDSDVIADYAAVPYDWRLRLGDILKTKEVSNEIVYDVNSSYLDSYIYKNLADLVVTSKSGKVTLVAHSNGGLVVKELLSQMENNNDPLLSKVDNVILVGVPQSGTPESVVSLLHGSELGPAGVVVSQETTRTLLQNMPFGYHLLPSDSYFEGAGATVDTPVITIEDGDVTSPWASTFGNEITSKSTLDRFLQAEGTRSKPVVGDLAHPQVANLALLGYTENVHVVQEDWFPSGSTKLYQVAGVGIDTVSNLTYFTDKKCVERNFFIPFICERHEAKLGYRVSNTIDGDGTVVSPSAVAMGEDEKVERWWLDFLRYNNDVIFDREHKNILEVQDVRDFVSDKIQNNDEVTYTYLQTNPIDLPDESRLVFQLHSPLDMKVITREGELSSTTESIAGGVYRRYGELQYISIPKANEITVVLTGTDEGSFTFEVEEWAGEDILERKQYEGIPTKEGTVVTFEITPSDVAQLLRIDFDGDGTVDGEIAVDGTVTNMQPEETVEELETIASRTKTTGTKVKFSQTGQVLGVATSTTLTNDEVYRAELYRLLTELSHLLELLNKNLYEK